jgi:hypothetical protein
LPGLGRVWPAGRSRPVCDPVKLSALTVCNPWHSRKSCREGVELDHRLVAGLNKPASRAGMLASISSGASVVPPCGSIVARLDNRTVETFATLRTIASRSACRSTGRADGGPCSVLQRVG